MARGDKQSHYPHGVDGRTLPKPAYVANLQRAEALEARKRDWRLHFLRAYADTGNITRSCKIACIDPKEFYKARRNDTEFAESFEVAHRAATDKALEAVWKIGVEGEREAIVWQGEIIGYRVTRDWKAAKFLLETFDPGTYSQRERIARMGMMQADQLNSRRDQMLVDAEKRMQMFGKPMPALPETVDADVVEDEGEDDD